MTDFEMSELVRACTYKPGWSIVFYSSGTRPYIQLNVEESAPAALDSQGTGNRYAWSSSKRYLSPHMCRQEVVGAVFALIKDAEAHEMHEWFRFRGASIYNPHLDPEVLALVARKAGAFNVRANAMTMEEPAS